MKVLLLPGLDGTGGMFKPFIETLPSEVDVLLISYPPNSRLGYQELTKFVMQQLPEEKFILVAESFSGYIAYQIALRKPKNLKSIIFVATFLENPRSVLLGLSSWLPMNYILSVPIPNYIVKRFLLGLSANKKMIALFKESIKQVSPAILSYRLKEIAQLPNSHQPCKIKATYIQATDDKLIPKKCVESFKKTFAGIKVIQIKASHFVLQVNPLACAEVLVNEVDSIVQ